MNEQAVAWALHALEPDEEMAVLLHLPQCASCQEAVRDAEEVLSGLGAAVEQVDPPPSLRENLLARAAETPQHPSVTEPPARAQTPPPVQAGAGDPAPRHRAEDRRDRTRPADGRPGARSWLSRRGRRILAASLALAAVLTVGGLAVRTAQLEQQRDAEIAQAQSLEDLLRMVDQPGAQHALLTAEDGTTVAAVLVADGQRQVMPLGLEPNATDNTTYVLWGMTGPDDTTPQAVGTFDVAPAERGLRPVGSVGEADGFSLYAISIEQGRTAPASPSGVIASGQVEI